MSLKPTFICCTTNQHGFGLSVLAMQDHQVCDIEGKLNKQLSLPFSATVSEGTHVNKRKEESEAGQERANSEIHLLCTGFMSNVSSMCRICTLGTSAIVKLAFQRAPKHYLNVYKSSGPVSQRQAVLKADHENRVCSLVQEHTAAYQ